MTDAILEITDGTTSISLINPSSGFHLVNWIPAITDYKGGGVFQNPPLADWRQLRSAHWATAEENFGLHINGMNADSAIYNLQELRRLLEKANQYWTTDWQNTPVYIKARAKCETNTRYGLVVKGRLGNDRNPYDQPFTGRVTTMQDLPLVIERRAWLETSPGSNTDIQSTNYYTFDGRVYGYVNSSETVLYSSSRGNFFIGNRYTGLNLTHIFRFDDSAGTFSSNLISGPFPFDLFPSSTAVGDICYFGIGDFADHVGVFQSLIFDLATAASSTGSYFITWEYWNGSVWDTMTPGGVAQLNQTGIINVTWTVNIMERTTVNSVNAFWVRARISSLSGTFTSPEQQNRRIYTNDMNWLEVPAGQVPGDITALLRNIVFGEEETSLTLKLLVGLRSTSRGNLFRSMWAIEENTLGQGVPAITAHGGVSTSIVDDSELSGRAIQYAADNTALANRAYFTVTEALSSHYGGTFRALIVCYRTSTATDYTMRLSVRTDTTASGNELYKTEIGTLDFGSANSVVIVDIGLLELPRSIEDLAQYRVTIQAGSNALTGNLLILGLFLLPVDEWAAEFNGQNFSESINDTPTNLIVDSISFPAFPLKASLVNSSDRRIAYWNIVANGPAQLQANQEQRLFYLAISNDDLYESYAIFESTLERQARYLSLRGNR